jgi:hypothetical protein
MVAVDSLGRPPWLRDLNFQKSRKPWRCQRRRVVGFEDEKGCLPILDATGKKNEPEAIRLSKGRLVDLAVEDDQLLTEQGVLCDEIGFAARQVGCGSEDD